LQFGTQIPALRASRSGRDDKKVAPPDVSTRLDRNLPEWRDIFPLALGPST
jgi:hypothetical protein